MCSRKAGASGRALILSTAIWSVPATSLFGSFEKPMWLSLIWTKVKSPLPASAVSAPSRRDVSTPPVSVQATPAPTQAMHSQHAAAVDAVVVRIVGDAIVHCEFSVNGNGIT